MGERARGWKGGRILKKTRGLNYITVYKPDHPFADPKGYMLEHRLVMEQYIGRYLKPEDIVHHENGNGLDNRIENLRLMTQAQHMAIERRRRCMNKQELRVRNLDSSQ
jgi:hypothetical protein